MTERRAYSRTGLNALKARVKVRGLQAIDRRTAGAQELLVWRAKLVADLGGEEEMTAARQVLVERLLDALATTGEHQGHRDVTILRSLPGVGRVVAATMLAEASRLLAARDYHGL